MKKLSKQLNLLHVFCIASGAMISSGIFVLPGLAHAKAGPAVVFSYFLAGLLATAGLLSIAELTTAMPKAGGDYFYISRGLGPATGTIAGLLSWFSLSLKSAFALIGMAVLVAPFVPLSWHGASSLRRRLRRLCLISRLLCHGVNRLYHRANILVPIFSPKKRFSAFSAVSFTFQ